MASKLFHQVLPLLMHGQAASELLVGALWELPGLAMGGSNWSGQGGCHGDSMEKPSENHRKMGKP